VGHKAGQVVLSDGLRVVALSASFGGLSKFVRAILYGSLANVEVDYPHFFGHRKFSHFASLEVDANLSSSLLK